MKTRLSRDTMAGLLATAPFVLGHQYKTDHLYCPAGEDMKKRLYYKVTDDGKMLLAHCFNCGGNGASRLQRVNLSTEKAPAKPKDMDSFDIDAHLYAAASPIIEYEAVDSWPLKYFFHDAEAWEGFKAHDGFGIKHSICYIVIPKGFEDGQITGYICRHKLDKRYTNSTHPNYNNSSSVLIYNTKNSRIAVVCEDAISAMKVCLAGFAGVALCGTNLTQDDAHKLSMLYDKVVVWLDNDKPEVNAKATENVSRLRLYNDCVSKTMLATDPKHYTLEDIRGIVKGHLIK
jgi:hypothetical protein